MSASTSTRPAAIDRDVERFLSTVVADKRAPADQDLLVEARGLTKKYGDRTSVDNLNMTIRRGEVYGFLGPNGAGKTATLRMLHGLIKPTSGTAVVVGRAPGDPEGLRRVGALVESPAFYPYLTGRDNLEVLARYTGSPSARIDEVLETVELSNRADDQFKTYSLGMKQRLGVAAALIKEPDLLILDEPTNGLDPKGMADMRDLVRKLGVSRTSVVLSSHLLGEVENICDRVGIIRQGRLNGSDNVTVVDETIHLQVDPIVAPAVARELIAAGVELLALQPRQQTLEDVFLSLTDDV